MKIISELNSKGWYRLLKVVYIVILICVFLITVYILYAEITSSAFEWGVKKLDSSKTIVYCTQLDKKTGDYNQATFQDYDYDWAANSKLAGGIKDPFNYKYYIFHPDNRAILILGYCYDFNSYNDAGIIKLRTEYNTDNKVSSAVDENINMAGRQLNFREKLFDIKPVFYIYYDYIDLLIFLAIFVGIGLIFEAIRRIFYYVVLGTIKPQK